MRATVDADKGWAGMYETKDKLHPKDMDAWPATKWQPNTTPLGICFWFRPLFCRYRGPAWGVAACEKRNRTDPHLLLIERLVCRLRNATDMPQWFSWNQYRPLEHSTGLGNSRYPAHRATHTPTRTDTATHMRAHGTRHTAQHTPVVHRHIHTHAGSPLPTFRQSFKLLRWSPLPNVPFLPFGKASNFRRGRGGEFPCFQ